MTVKEAITELYQMQTEAWAEVEKYKRYGLDGGRNQRKADALTVALQYLMHAGAK